MASTDKSKKQDVTTAPESATRDRRDDAPKARSQAQSGKRGTPDRRKKDDPSVADEEK